VTGQGNGGATDQVRSSFHWRVRYELLFVDHRGHQLGAIAKPHPIGAGTWSVAFSNAGEESCSRAGGLLLNRYGAISGDIQRDGWLVMELFPGSNDYRTVHGSGGSGLCATSDFWRNWVQGFSRVGSGAPVLDPLTAVVLLGPRQLHRHRLSLAVSNHSLFEPQLTIDPDCGSVSGSSCSQSFAWTGTVTLTKLPRR